MERGENGGNVFGPANLLNQHLLHSLRVQVNGCQGMWTEMNQESRALNEKRVWLLNMAVSRHRRRFRQVKHRDGSPTKAGHSTVLRG